MGLAGYYSANYLQGFSQIVVPITSLQRKGKFFEWTKSCEQDFQLLKDNLMTTPILIIPNPNVQFKVITNSLGDGLGAVKMGKWWHMSQGS